MRFARSITKATDTNLEYVKFIAFRRQQWLRGSNSLLRDTCAFLPRNLHCLDGKLLRMIAARFSAHIETIREIVKFQHLRVITARATLMCSVWF